MPLSLTYKSKPMSNEIEIIPSKVEFLENIQENKYSGFQDPFPGKTTS